MLKNKNQVAGQMLPLVQLVGWVCPLARLVKKTEFSEKRKLLGLNIWHLKVSTYCDLVF